MTPYEIAKAYESGEIKGWSGYELAKQQWPIVSQRANFIPFNIYGATRETKGTKTMLYQVARKVLGKDTENISQAIGDCWHGSTNVTMYDGTVKNIKDVKVGDLVLTHKNRAKKVIRTIEKKFSGDLFTIKLDSHYKELICTNNHELVSYKTDNPHEYEWVRADTLCIKKDRLVVPYGIERFECQHVYFNNKEIEVTKDFAFIIGWYLAEGGISERELKDSTPSYQKITFNLGIDEEHVAELLIEKIKKVFGVQAVVQNHKNYQNVILVEIYDVALSTLFKTLMPGNVYDKRVPRCIMLSPKEIKRECLLAWIAGDGHDTGRCLSGCSVSNEMIEDFYHISIALGISPKYKVVPKQPHQNADAKILYWNKCARARLLNNDFTERDGRVRFCNMGLLKEIESITKEKVEDYPVYCLEVEGDNSFIANGCVSKNCVSWGARNAAEYLTCTDILIRGERERFRPVFAPYYYGTGRVLVGTLDGSNEDGSLGSWMAEAVMKYGTLFADEQGVPKYSGQVAKAWGRDGPPKQWVDFGKKYLIRSAAQIKDWGQLVDSIANGYPAATASDVGYNMEPSSDGFHRQTTTWNHQMCVIGVDDNDKDPYAIILNSWGPDAHGQLKDFDDGHELPGGVLRVRRKDIEKHIRQGETFAYSQGDFFKEQRIDEKLFKII